ncbi:ATP-binding cassette domain-containing protein [Bradyrhizobium brasilense]|uniref:ATP-binding cassette domain-containing protein n=1 Tax=Bradyrhizobium brasilense TaxID=1419277 RepID=UPI000B87F8B4|nr:ATP-binding cassette domain-containing protein [Bradyrhizobium brasilense]
MTDLSSSVLPGAKLALIGASGSGKTTILRKLMTLETVPAGSVVVAGQPLWSAATAMLSPRQREAHLQQMRHRG